MVFTFFGNYWRRSSNEDEDNSTFTPRESDDGRDDIAKGIEVAEGEIERDMGGHEENIDIIENSEADENEKQDEKVKGDEGVNRNERETEGDDKDHDQTKGDGRVNDDNVKTKGDGDNNKNENENEGDGKDKDAEHATSSLTYIQPQNDPPSPPKAIPQLNVAAPDEETLLVFDKAFALRTKRNLKGGKDFKFPNFAQVISETEKTSNTPLSESTKNQLKKRMPRLERRETPSTWGITENIKLDTDRVHWTNKQCDGIDYKLGFTEKGAQGFATAESSDEARELAKIHARAKVKKLLSNAFKVLSKLSQISVSEKESIKLFWPMGVPPNPTTLGNTSMMLFSGDVLIGYDKDGFKNNCEEALQHIRELRTPSENGYSVHDWGKVFIQCLNDPERGGAKKSLAQHAIKLANTRATYRCIWNYRNDRDKNCYELNPYTSQYFAAILVLGNLSSVDKHALASKRQNQAVALNNLLPVTNQPTRVLHLAVYQPMQVLGQSEDQILSVILPKDADREAYDFSDQPSKAPNLNDDEYHQAQRTFESMQHQNRTHNQPHLLPACAVTKGKEQRELWKKFLGERRAGKKLCWEYSFYYPKLKGKALMDVIMLDIKQDPKKNSTELCGMAYERQGRKYRRNIKIKDPKQKELPVSKNGKRKHGQNDTPKEAKRARTSKKQESKKDADWLPPTKSDTGDYTNGGKEWIKQARGSIKLLHAVADDVMDLALNETTHKVLGYTQDEIRSELFSGTTMVNTRLTTFSLPESELEKLFHLDCRNFILAFGLVNSTELNRTAEDPTPQSLLESLCTWIQPDELEALSWQSALVAKCFRSGDDAKLPSNNYSAKKKNLIQRIRHAIKP